MQFSPGSPSRFEVVLWFFRVTLLIQVLGVIGVVFQTFAFGRILSGSYASPGIWQWGISFVLIVFLWLAAKPLCYAATANDDSPLTWMNVALPTLGLALIAGNLTYLWPLLLEVVPYVIGLLSGGNVTAMSSRGTSLTYSFLSLGFSGLRLLLGFALAFIPPLRARWRATANR